MPPKGIHFVMAMLRAQEGTEAAKAALALHDVDDEHYSDGQEVVGDDECVVGNVKAMRDAERPPFTLSADEPCVAPVYPPRHTSHIWSSHQSLPFS